MYRTLSKMRNTLFNQIILITAFLGLSSAFLLVDNCPVSPPCTCSGSSGYSSYIHCENKSLTNIPNIKQSSSHVNTLYLYFYSNKLTVIPNNAFGNFISIAASDIRLRLDGNQIHTLESKAFNGIGNTITVLELQNNNLNTLPSAITILVNLRYLDIQGNPLSSLDASVMSLIGKSLISFRIDIKTFTEWPSELRYLRLLEYLSVNQIPFPHLDVNAFHGFEKTLKGLTLENSKLEKVPYAICNLSQLSMFIFRYNYHLQETKSSIFEPCGTKLLNVGIFYIGANSLNIFPDMFSLFPSLTLISAVANRHQYIDDTKIPFDSNVTVIHLSANVFDRIPYALNRMNRLTHVYLSQNRITTIEKHDLSNLTALTLLYLNDNPIKYIANDAFKNNIELSYLDLQNTLLDHVPIAVTSLTKLSTFILSGMPVDCTCDMSYLKHWNVYAVSTFTTKCAYTLETVKSFVMNSLHTCP